MDTTKMISKDNLAVAQNKDALIFQDSMMKCIQQNTHHTIIQTPKISGAMVDGFFQKNGVMTGIFEMKYWRDTENSQKRISENIWFIDKYKLNLMISLTSQFCVPCYLFAGFRETIYVFKMTDAKGNLLIRYKDKTIQMNNTTFGKEKKIVERVISEFSISQSIQKIQNTWLRQ
jgi:hypothetical protein